MNNHTKQQALLYISLAVIGIMILGASLANLNFQAGLPIPGAETVSQVKTTSPAGSTPGAQFYLPWLTQAALAFGIVLLLIVLITLVIKKGNIKQVAGIAAVILILYVILNQFPKLSPEPQTLLPEKEAARAVPSFEYTVSPIGNPPAGLFLMVGIGLLIAVLILTGWLLVKAFYKHPQEDRLSLEANAAVQAIAEGQDLKNVIVRCYLKMEQLMQEEQGIEREDTVTAREFEKYLVGHGIPQLPILQLTRLFEKARYGNQPLTQQDEQDAVNCLVAIGESSPSARRGMP